VRFLLPILSLALLHPALSGCAAAAPGVGSGGGARSRLYVGIVRVVQPDSRGKLSALSTKALGLGWDAGPYLGWKADEWVIADPADCQLLVIVRAAAEADNARRVIESLGGMNPCVIDHTGSLRR
jgi:hypothetical protein